LDVFEDEDAGSEGRFGLDVFAVVEDLLWLGRVNHRFEEDIL
jgi:hypothetical protein